MANTYKNIVITPGINSSVDDPKIVFSGANTTTNTDITLRTYPTSSGTLSFEGTAGQLFSITNDLSGVLFSVNDISGIPSMEAYANGDMRFAEFSGNVSIGTSNSSSKLFVNGNTVVNGAMTHTSTWNTADATGAIYLNAATGNRIDWVNAGVAAPATTTRSAGTKLVLYPGVSSTQVDYGIGVESGYVWFSAPASTTGFKWYANTVNFMTANTTGLNMNSSAISGVTTLTTSSYVKTTAMTVASLPSAATAGAGARSYVSDLASSVSGNFGATAVGAGSNAAPVWSDGTNWRIG